MLARDDRGELVLALGEEVAQPEQHIGALGQAGRAPARKGGLGGGDRALHIRGAAEHDLVLLDAGGGVVDGSGADRFAGRAAVDQMADEGHGTLLEDLPDELHGGDSRLTSQ